MTRKCKAKLRYTPAGASSFRSHTCSRKAAPGSNFCPQHDPEAVAARDERNKLAADEKFRRRVWNMSGERIALRAALARISGSHHNSSAHELREIARVALNLTWKDV